MSTRSHNIIYDPAKLLDENLNGIPESWQQSMQLIRPITGLNLCCIRGKPGANWAFNSAGGPNLTIGLLLEGHMETGIENGTEFQLESGQALLMAVGTKVSGWNVLSARNHIHLLNFNVSPQALLGLTGMQIDDVLNVLRQSRCDRTHVNVGMARVPALSALHRIAADITRCSYLNHPARNVFICAKVAECLALMLNHCVLTHVNPGILRNTPCDRPRLLRARALLEKQYAQPWPVRSLARAVGLNEKRLQAGFQALYGCTVHTCLTRIRLDISKALLASGYSVTDTAHATGFANSSHFSKVFRCMTGISPKYWSHNSGLMD